MEEIIGVMASGGRALAIGVGVGAALILTRSFRPLAKQAVKGYLVASEGMRRATAGAREGLQDIYAEAKAEQQAQAQPGGREVGTQPHAQPGPQE